MPREPKLQRWTDLIAALLRRNYPATFEELARDVPAYADESKKKDAVMRMFERDKDELRSFGIAIDTIAFEDDHGDASGYRLDRKTFYLPYLSLAARQGKSGSQPRRPAKYGYRALTSLVFEPDELELIAAAGDRIRTLGDPVLTEEADSAIRKLSFDLPLKPGEDQRAIVQQKDLFEILNDSLSRRKKLRFTYRSMSSDATTTREVEPYGLFYLSSHWYLAARDVEKSELRNFRLNRMSGVSINTARSQSADYEIPSSFNLRRHARSKKPWDLGESIDNEAIVDFIGATGAAKAAAQLGVAIEGASDRRKFRIRRVDSFARWLLSFGGEAIPVSPPSLVREFNQLVASTAELYA